MTDWLELAGDNRDAILLLEVVGLLHDIGKMSDEFLKSQAQDTKSSYAGQYDYLAIVNPSQAFDDSMLEQITDWIGNLAGKDAPFKLMTEKQRDALCDTYLITSGKSYSVAEILLSSRREDVLKAWSDDTSKPMTIAWMIQKLHGISHYEKEARKGDEDRQPYEKMCRATPFGHEVLIPVDNDQGLTAVLKTLPLTELDKILTEERGAWLRRMRELMIQAPADTRRPANEVTLWDWGYTVASFAKAALPTVLAEDWDGNWGDLQWRVLRVNLDIPALLARSSKIGDALGTRAEIRGRFNELKRLLEEELAIANELYRDETGIYFIFPNHDLPDEIAQRIRDCFPPDIRPVVSLTPAKVTALKLDPRGGKSEEEVPKLIAKPREEARRELKHPISATNLPDLAGEWEGVRAEVCMVCGLRPVASYQAAADQHLCHPCFIRRKTRVENWLARLDTTIWLDEATDLNGRAALLVGRLGLEGWLDGSLEHTIIVDEVRREGKYPSPARLRRIVETARHFWETVLEARDDKPTIPVAYGRRLEIEGQAPDSLDPNHVYELRLPAGRTLSAVWDGRRFVTADNLVYVANQLDWRPPDGVDAPSVFQVAARQWLKEKHLDGRTAVVEEPVGYGGKNKTVGSLTHIQCRNLSQPRGYYPFIPILAEPMWFQAILPADHVLAAIRRIQEKYQAEMGKVRNRLPLNLGVIFFPRRTPLRAVIEAGRAMLRGFAQMDGESEAWTVESTDSPADCAPEKSPPIVRLSLKRDGRSSVTLLVDLRMGDRETSDLWYPYWQLTGERLKHTCELAEGDQVRFSPSRFDFEFLDTTARRFEISYGEDGRRSHRRSRPFLLDDLQRLEVIWEAMCHLEKSQRHQMISAIETAREDWFGTDSESRSWTDGVFRRFVHDTLAGAAWPAQYKWQTIETGLREQLIEVGATGLLADLAELRMEILKG